MCPWHVHQLVFRDEHGNCSQITYLLVALLHQLRSTTIRAAWNTLYAGAFFLVVSGSDDTRFFRLSRLLCPIAAIAAPNKGQVHKDNLRTTFDAPCSRIGSNPILQSHSHPQRSDGRTTGSSFNLDGYSGLYCNPTSKWWVTRSARRRRASRNDLHFAQIPHNVDTLLLIITLCHGSICSASREENTGVRVSGSLVLLCYKVRRRQQGQRGRDRARWVAIRRRRVAIECGLCRSVLTGSASGRECWRQAG